MTERPHILSPAVKLTAAYVAIIMLISLFFSLTVYHLASDQLRLSLGRQRLIYHNDFGSSFLVPPDPSQIQTELSEGRGRLALQLLYFNLIILGLGSAASYWLAKRTLRPIEEALDSQSRFTADASHELRTPLTAMQTEIEVALRDSRLTKDQAKKLLQSNLEEVAKLRALADGLLRLARHDGHDLATNQVSLAEVATDAMTRVLSLAQAKKISIDNQAADVLVTGDQPGLTELVVILLDNAIKYSPGGSSIKLSTRQLSKQGTLTVTDQGQGIKASELPHVFDRFYRADQSRSKDKADGYGLGLSIAKQIAETHHGSIDVSSTPGKGSAFTVRLPLAG